MKVLKVDEVKIEEVLNILYHGGVIIYPTETLYGIGVKFDLRESLKKVFDIKKRPEEKTFPLIVNKENIFKVVDFIPPLAQKLIEKYWPGPLTLILPAKKNLPEEIVKECKVAVRMPGSSFALKLIEASPFPITATSANISGQKPSSSFEEVLNYFKDSSVDILIDGGKLLGIPSTIVDVTVEPPKILRKGAIELSFY